MEIEEIVQQKIKEALNIDELEELSIDTDLKKCGMDSLNAIELVVALEMQFGIEFDEDDLLVDNLCSIRKLLNIVKKYIRN